MYKLRIAAVSVVGCFLSSSVASAQVQSYEVTKTLYYAQDSVNAAPSVTTAARFTTRLNASSGDDFDSVTFLPPLAAFPIPLQDTLNDGGWKYPPQFFASKQDMDDAFLNGPTTQFQTSGGNFGSQSGDVTLDNDYYPSPGYLTGTSLTDLQGYDPAVEITLEMSGFSFPALSDRARIDINVFDENFDSVFDSPSLNPSTFELVIPANTFQPQSEYVLEIAHWASDRTEDTGFGNGVPSFASYETRTQVSFTTGGVVVPEPATLSLLVGASAMLLRRRT